MEKKKKIKTVEEWFEAVEHEKVKELLLERIDRNFNPYPTISLQDAIESGFSWNKSHEGILFWKYCVEVDDPAEIVRRIAFRKGWEYKPKSTAERVEKGIGYISEKLFSQTPEEFVKPFNNPHLPKN